MPLLVYCEMRYAVVTPVDASKKSISLQIYSPRSCSGTSDIMQLQSLCVVCSLEGPCIERCPSSWASGILSDCETHGMLT